MKAQLYKFSRRICSSLFSLLEIKPLLVSEIIFCIWDFVACQCKVSRLLAAMYLLSASSKLFSLSSSCKVLSESHWASFFHQTSLGTRLNYQFLSNRIWRFKARQLLDSKDLHVSGSSDIGSEICNLLRIAPESIQDLEQSVKDVFVGLSWTTIICISLLGGSYSALLKELLLYPSCVFAWVLLLRLKSMSDPIVMLLPVNTLLEEVSDDENDANSEFEGLHESNDCEKNWHCPWGFIDMDNVAPAFKLNIGELPILFRFSFRRYKKEKVFIVNAQKEA